MTTNKKPYSYDEVVKARLLPNSLRCKDELVKQVDVLEDLRLQEDWELSKMSYLQLKYKILTHNALSEEESIAYRGYMQKLNIDEKEYISHAIEKK